MVWIGGKIKKIFDRSGRSTQALTPRTGRWWSRKPYRCRLAL